MLHNPLQRMERLSTGWFGVIADYEGVVVDSTIEVHKEAWRQVAVEMNLPMPLGSTLNRIKGVRDEVIIMQLFTWTRNPTQASKIAARKEEIYDQLMNGNSPAEVPGVRAFLETLHNYKIPVALASSLPERRVRPALERLDLTRSFDAVVTAEDNGSPEVEMFYLAAAHQLQRPPLRCVVVGDSNRSVEAAHELGMKSVVVTGGQPAWNFGGADLVVRGLGQLSFVNMKKLFGQESLVESSTPWDEIRQQQREREAEEMSMTMSTGASFDDGGSYNSSTSTSSYATTPAWLAEAQEQQQQQQVSSWEAAREAGRGGGAALVREWEREREPAVAAYVGQDRSVGEDEDEDFEVILPPNGAAFWDHQR